MHFFSSSKESRARTKLHAVAAAAAGAAMLAACGGGSDDRGAVPVLFPVPSAAQPASPPPAPAVTAQKACGELNGKTVAGAALTAAMQDAAASVPAYCKVTGTIAPALNFQISLPEAWNGKLYYQGGGGYNGAISPPSVPALGQGYAVVASDSGHQGNVLSADFALTDTFAAQLFGSLSVPTVMSTATETLAAAYGALPAKSYFEGCSNGGREALMAVQRAPNLFDGVISRAPAYNWVGFMGAFNRNSRALAVPGGAFSAAKTALLSKHVRDACDGLDGVVDSVVSNQAACTPLFRSGRRRGRLPAQRRAGADRHHRLLHADRRRSVRLRPHRGHQRDLRRVCDGRQADPGARPGRDADQRAQHGDHRAHPRRRRIGVPGRGHSDRKSVV